MEEGKFMMFAGRKASAYGAQGERSILRRFASIVLVLSTVCAVLLTPKSLEKTKLIIVRYKARWSTVIAKGKLSHLARRS